MELAYILRVETEIEIFSKEMRRKVFNESLSFRNEMRVSQTSDCKQKILDFCTYLHSNSAAEHKRLHRNSFFILGPYALQ